MGTFTTVENVKSLFRRLKIADDTGVEKTNTVVTTEEVNEFIDETESMVKARLAICYTGSYGSESTTIIGTIVKYKVAQVIKGIMELTTQTSDRKTQDMTANWGKMADDMLDKICPEQECGTCKIKPTMPLPDTSITSEPPEGANLFNSSSNTSTFSKSKANW